ncbi:hypothetical protein CMO91_06220 [Candidatus Woesearchaeota archaeon]|nr:hypothetical protein [Candidatus Woesearchaeota archaeon]
MLAIGGRDPKSTRAGSTTRWVRRIITAVVLIVVISGGVGGYKILAASNRITTADRSILGQLKDLLFSQGKVLDGETEGRINIMLAAVGGEGHKGQNLADTIMVASIVPETNQVALLSIPRDMYVQVPGEEYYSKINAVHAYGEAQKEGQGPVVLQTLVEEITGLPIHYYGRIDFTGFTGIIDAVGGVEIAIDNSFFDYWHKIDFRAGQEHMDGDRALAYVRARYVEGPEGGDFKRAARQQQALLALRENIFSVNTALDFGALSNILDSVSENVRTDLQLWEMKRFYELARTIDRENVGSVVLSTGPKGVLVGTTEVLGGSPASVLKPRIGNYSEIQELAANMLTNTATSVPVAAVEETPEELPAEEEQAEVPKSFVEIRNGTTITGLASRTRETVQDEGFEVTAIGNAATRDNDETKVYAVTDDATESAKAIAELLGAQIDSGLPADETATEAGVLIILGADS